MPYYFITVTLKNGSVVSGIKEITTEWIEIAWEEYCIKANHYFGTDIMDFDLIMISSYSKRCIAYRDRNLHKKKINPVNGKYRRGAPKGNDKGWGKKS